MYVTMGFMGPIIYFITDKCCQMELLKVSLKASKGASLMILFWGGGLSFKMWHILGTKGEMMLRSQLLEYLIPALADVL